MRKFLFDEAGLQELSQALYSMDDAQLALEVAALENNFSGWILQHFQLTAEQYAFFMQLNPQLLKFLTSQCSYAVENRLAIELSKTGGKSSQETGEPGDKLFEPKSKLQAGSDSDGNFKASGSLLLSVTYS